MLGKKRELTFQTLGLTEVSAGFFSQKDEKTLKVVFGQFCY
jgi:hypothetical protein